MEAPGVERRKTVNVTVGNVQIGGDHPIVVQSMTNTDTADVAATTDQVQALWEAGSELVRITVNTSAAADAVPVIAAELSARGVDVPLIGDFHFNGHLLLPGHPDCAEALAKYRINPGNVGKTRWDEHFGTIVECAMAHSKPVRIGVNWGSLDQVLLTRMMDENASRDEPLDAHEVMLEAIVESALASARAAETIGMQGDQIILSAKVSRLPDLVHVYKCLAARCEYPLHLGLTEAGMGRKGTVASSAALGIVLSEGIGDTIRVSLTPEPGADRTEEVRVAQQILQSLELRSFKPQVTACPGCGRTTSTYFQTLALEVEKHIAERLAKWRDTLPGVEDLSVAVMGCVVNGPGESKHADIGISLPGTFEEPTAPVYVDGQHSETLRGDDLVEDFLAILDRYVENRFGVEVP